MRIAKHFTIVRNNRGFTLFEALAAAMILAISLTVIMQLFSGGLRAGHLSDMYTRATWHAREKMDTILLLREISATHISGAWEDGFAWQATLAEQSPSREDRQSNQLKAFSITVEVYWTEGKRKREVTLECLTLARMAAEPT